VRHSRVSEVLGRDAAPLHLMSARSLRIFFTVVVADLQIGSLELLYRPNFPSRRSRQPTESLRTLPSPAAVPAHSLLPTLSRGVTLRLRSLAQGSSLRSACEGGRDKCCLPTGKLWRAGSVPLPLVNYLPYHRRYLPHLCHQLRVLCRQNRLNPIR
jgi:hypothetical protein